MEILGERHHCVAPELRGFGGSTLDGEYSLADLADDMELVRAHLSPDQPIHLVSLSMGGYVAFEYWRKYRHHLSSLTLANTKPNADDEVARAGRLAMAEQAISQGAWEAVAPMLPKLLAPQSIGSSAEQIAKSMLQSARPEAVAAAQKAMASRKDFSESLESITIPSLVIAGEFDGIVPSAATRQWASCIPNSQIHEIAGVGHLSPLEAPVEFSSVLTTFFSE